MFFINFLRDCFSFQPKKKPQEPNDSKNSTYMNHANYPVIQLLKRPRRQQQKDRRVIGGLILNSSPFKISYRLCGSEGRNTKQTQSRPSSGVSNPKVSLNRKDYIKNLYQQSRIQVDHHKVRKQGFQNMVYGKKQLSIIAMDLDYRVVQLLVKYPIQKPSDAQLEICSDLTVRKIQFPMLLELNGLPDNRQFLRVTKINNSNSMVWTESQLKAQQAKIINQFEFVQLQPQPQPQPQHQPQPQPQLQPRSQHLSQSSQKIIIDLEQTKFKNDDNQSDIRLTYDPSVILEQIKIQRSQSLFLRGSNAQEIEVIY